RLLGPPPRAGIGSRIHSMVDYPHSGILPLPIMAVGRGAASPPRAARYPGGWGDSLRTGEIRSMADARVEAATRSLAPRFLAHGVEYADVVRTTSQIEQWSDWLDAWVSTGDAHLTLADEADAKDRARTAGEAYVRAAVCFHFGK